MELDVYFSKEKKGRRTKTDTEKISLIRKIKKIPKLIFHEFYTLNQRKKMNLYKLNKAWKRSFHEGLLPWLSEDIELEQEDLEVMYKDYFELSVPKHKLDKIHEVAFKDDFDFLIRLGN